MRTFVALLVAIAALAIVPRADALGALHTGVVNLTGVTFTGPGIGFLFSNSSGVTTGSALATKSLPGCTVMPLDSQYFYVFGCDVDVDFVPQLAAAVPTFQYATDKSITSRAGNAQSLLLANAWNLILTYEGSTAARGDAASACAADAARAARDVGCVVTPACHLPTPSATVGCGSLTCEGCLLDGFWVSFGFTSARFDDQP